MKRYLPIVIIIFFLSLSTVVYAQTLDSSNYSIINSTIDSGGGISTSTGYGLLTSAGVAGADIRLESTNYRLNAGFPNSFQANVPIIICFETNTDSGSTNCNDVPGGNGMRGVCGEPGCYDRAKIEIDDQNNPTDTLYLVALSTNSFTTTYYLQSDHSLNTNFDISDYMTQCELEGKDLDDTLCDDAGDGNWNEDLQTYNIIGLKPGTTYEIKVRAVHGDFTETEFSQIESSDTELPTIQLDVDAAPTDTDTPSPHSIPLGILDDNTPTTAVKSIWIDINSNALSGVNVYVNNLGQGLYSSENSTSIPSESEDLDTPDADGGYGLKIGSITQTSLGPLISDNLYNTVNTNQVGGLSSSPSPIFYTNTSGSNKGPISGGRGRIYVKALSFTSLPEGIYTDTITFTALGNW